MFEVSIPIWVRGRILEVERVNPHSFITLRDSQEDAKAPRWAVEGPSLVQLEQRGVGPDFLRAGEVVEFCAFAPKAEFTRGATAPSWRVVHGLVLVTPDGARQMWGSYGRLTECIRSKNDQRQSWIDFLNAKPGVQETWCRERKALQAAGASTTFEDELMRSLAKPCT
jgi:hypothetical protein